MALDLSRTTKESQPYTSLRRRNLPPPPDVSNYGNNVVAKIPPHTQYNTTDVYKNRLAQQPEVQDLSSLRKPPSVTDTFYGRPDQLPVNKLPVHNKVPSSTVLSSPTHVQYGQKSPPYAIKPNGLVTSPSTHAQIQHVVQYQPERRPSQQSPTSQNYLQKNSQHYNKGQQSLPPVHAHHVQQAHQVILPEYRPEPSHPDYNVPVIPSYPHTDPQVRTVSYREGLRDPAMQHYHGIRHQAIHYSRAAPQHHPQHPNNHLPDTRPNTYSYYPIKQDFYRAPIAVNVIPVSDNQNEMGPPTYHPSPIHRNHIPVGPQAHGYITTYSKKNQVYHASPAQFEKPLTKSREPTPQHHRQNPYLHANKTLQPSHPSQQNRHAAEQTGHRPQTNSLLQRHNSHPLQQSSHSPQQNSPLQRQNSYPSQQNGHPAQQRHPFPPLVNFGAPYRTTTNDVANKQPQLLGTPPYDLRKERTVSNPSPLPAHSGKLNHGIKPIDSSQSHTQAYKVPATVALTSTYKKRENEPQYTYVRQPPMVPVHNSAPIVAKVSAMKTSEIPPVKSEHVRKREITSCFDLSKNDSKKPRLIPPELPPEILQTTFPSPTHLKRMSMMQPTPNQFDETAVNLKVEKPVKVECVSISDQTMDLSRKSQKSNLPSGPYTASSVSSQANTSSPNFTNTEIKSEDVVMRSVTALSKLDKPVSQAISTFVESTTAHVSRNSETLATTMTKTSPDNQIRDMKMLTDQFSPEKQTENLSLNDSFNTSRPVFPTVEIVNSPAPVRIETDKVEQNETSPEKPDSILDRKRTETHRFETEKQHNQPEREIGLSVSSSEKSIITEIPSQQIQSTPGPSCQKKIAASSHQAIKLPTISRAELNETEVQPYSSPTIYSPSHERLIVKIPMSDNVEFDLTRECPFEGDEHSFEDEVWGFASGSSEKTTPSDEPIMVDFEEPKNPIEINAVAGNHEKLVIKLKRIDSVDLKDSFVIASESDCDQVMKQLGLTKKTPSSPKYAEEETKQTI